ncbi:MAG: hypothetical protein ACRDOI_31955 [Trebonia sp.]
MNEAAPQAAEGMSAGAERALAALQYDWGDAYRIGWDDEGGYWACRRDGLGEALTAPDRGALRRMIRADYELKPVARDTAEAAGNTSGLWCAGCGRQVTAASGPDLPAVHTATGLVHGEPEGHLAEPVDREPPLWKAARQITADYRGSFTVDARFGFLRAEWAQPSGPRVTVTAHYEADSEQEMRRLLDGAVARDAAR